jgi:hypothetical protein
LFMRVCLIFEGYIEALLGRLDILQARAHCAVARSEVRRSAHILLVTQKLWGIRLVLCLKFSYFQWLYLALTCSEGMRSMIAEAW